MKSIQKYLLFLYCLQCHHAYTADLSQKELSNPLIYVTDPEGEVSNQDFRSLLEAIKEDSKTHKALSPAEKKKIRDIYTQKISNIREKEFKDPSLHMPVGDIGTILETRHHGVHDPKVEDFVRTLLEDQSVTVYHAPMFPTTAMTFANVIICGPIRIEKINDTIGILDLLDESSPKHQLLKQKNILEKSFSLYKSTLFHEYGHIKVYRALGPTISELLLFIKAEKPSTSEYLSQSSKWSRAEEYAADANIPLDPALQKAWYNFLLLEHEKKEAIEEIYKLLRPTLHTVAQKGTQEYFKQYKTFRSLKPFQRQTHPSDKKRAQASIEKFLKINPTESPTEEKDLQEFKYSLNFEIDYCKKNILFFLSADEQIQNFYTELSQNKEVDTNSPININMLTIRTKAIEYKDSMNDWVESLVPLKSTLNYLNDLLIRKSITLHSYNSLIQAGRKILFILKNKTLEPINDEFLALKRYLIESEAPILSQIGYFFENDSPLPNHFSALKGQILKLDPTFFDNPITTP